MISSSLQEDLLLFDGFLLVDFLGSECFLMLRFNPVGRPARLILMWCLVVLTLGSVQRLFWRKDSSVWWIPCFRVSLLSYCLVISSEV